MFTLSMAFSAMTAPVGEVGKRDTVEIRAPV
jgi:hypothetical protein